MKFKLFKYLIINLIICCTKICLADDILGCGGFIKSHADIDFSKVEVKLFTKQGSLKDKTDCSPSNGYYFLPVYDKGEYLLKISPPPGWSFQPDQVAINFDGKTDVCSQGKDVNFVFKGFGITGVIEIDGDSENVGNIGGKGFNVELKSENGNDIRNTISDTNGIFFFSPVIPGKYTIKCSRPNWHLAVDEREVLVTTGNTELPKNSFIVDGFDVHGKILNDGQSIGNIGFALLEKKGQKSRNKCKSSKIISKVAITDTNFESTPLCYSLADIKTGEYKFDAIAPGIYLIVPHIENKNVHIRPESIEFFVNRDVVNIPKQFQIIGFSTSIRVLDSPNGKGIKEAEIKLNDKIVGQTDANGVYTFASIKTGTYTIQAIAEHYQFKDKTIQISIANPSMPDITADAFKVCGKVIAERSYTVTITKHASTFHVAITSAIGTGDWCYYLQNGKYNIQVLTDDADRAAGVQFFPAEQIIDVISSPISNIIFSQLRAIVSGEVRCLNDAGSNCLEITVTLTALDVNGHSTGQPILTALQSGTKYRFTDVLPGSYEVHVPNTILCWESNSFRITVKEATERIPSFIQTGYLVSVISSHTVKMSYNLRGSPVSSPQQQQQPNTKNLISEIQLTTGLNTFCVKESGHYDINFIGCHTYDPRTVPKQFYTGDKHPITVTAEQHTNGIQILSNEQHLHSKYEMSIESTNRLKQTLYATEGSTKINDYFVYRLSIDLRPDEIVRVIPQSGYMLFKPEYKEIRGGVDCVETAFTFTATKGLIIVGRTEPAIKDVEISVSFPNNSDMEDVRLQTDSNGSFRFGPIDSNLAVQLVAYKESYVFSEYDKQTNTFKARKLCEIIGNVKDEDGNKLVGVLLSLSGAESYRKNLVTGEDGTIKFHSLSPSQYFLRPMMKEYKFEPQSKIIDVADGQTIEVLLIGRRIAYSVFGTINSLNGEPFSNVIVEAISDEQCQWHQEEATTESTGNYRIRGLQSNCEYTVRVKRSTGKDVNVLIDRTIPVDRHITVENIDIKNINLIGISPLPSVDVIARVYASNIEYYKILQIKLNRKGGGGSGGDSGPVHTQLIETPMVNAKSIINPGYMVFFPRIPFDKKTYVIELETLSSARNYQYQMLSQSIVANRSTIYVEFNFTPEIRSNDNELNQNSISALILVGLVAIAFFRQDLAMEFINFVWTHLNSIVNGLMSKQKGFGGGGGGGGGNNNNSGGGGGGGNNGNNSNKNNKKYDIDENEIEKLAQSINATKRKTVRKVN